jgi:L-threonylcarbamoyladenylate synthase
LKAFDIIKSGEDPDTVADAVARLASGEIIGLPTETVYGLAANACDDMAVARIFAAKDRPRFNPLIVHVKNQDMAGEYAIISNPARALMDRFWPGPLTLVVGRKPDCGLGDLVSAGLDTLALRAPHHPVAQAILGGCGFPLAAPSANPSGSISPTTARHVAEALGSHLDLVVDGGPASVGIESTIVAVKSDHLVLLRPGIITKDELGAASGLPLRDGDNSKIEAPGQMQRHYAPAVPLRLSAFNAEEGEVLIGFGDIDGDFNLSAAGNLGEAAANLFSMLRQAENMAVSGIAVAPVPVEGLGIAINDRLTRGAA